MLSIHLTVEREASDGRGRVFTPSRLTFFTPPHSPVLQKA